MKPAALQRFERLSTTLNLDSPLWLTGFASAVVGLSSHNLELDSLVTVLDINALLQIVLRDNRLR